MAQRALPGFQVGDRAFLSDGRSGLITASRFDTVSGDWEHLIDGIFEFFFESALSLEPPIVEEELEAPPPVVQPPPLFVIPPDTSPVTRDELEGLVLAIVGEQPSAGVTQADLDALTLAIVTSANLTAQANLRAHIEDVERRAADVELFTAAQFSELESIVTTTLSEISTRAQALEAAAEGSSGFGFLGFINGLGGLISNPVEWIMSRLGDHISSEVNDGLNR